MLETKYNMLSLTTINKTTCFLQNNSEKSLPISTINEYMNGYGIEMSYENNIPGLLLINGSIFEEETTAL